MRPIALASTSVYHIASSGPRVMERGNFGEPGRLYSKKVTADAAPETNANANRIEARKKPPESDWVNTIRMSVVDAAASFYRLWRREQKSVSKFLAQFCVRG